MPLPERAHGQSFLDDTEFVDIRAGSRLTDIIRSARRQGYELADGTPVDMLEWYGSRWIDIGVTFLTRIDPNFGIYWGFGTGERGEKYVIRPSLELGFIKLFEISEREVISLSATAVIGGDLRERTCVADYGAIAGIQEVNCRLVASILPPAETLNYLFDEPASERIAISVQYLLKF